MCAPYSPTAVESIHRCTFLHLRRRDSSQDTLPAGGTYPHLGRVRSAGLDMDRHGPHHFYRRQFTAADRHSDKLIARRDKFPPHCCRVAPAQQRAICPQTRSSAENFDPFDEPCLVRVGSNRRRNPLVVGMKVSISSLTAVSTGIMPLPTNVRPFATSWCADEKSRPAPTAYTGWWCTLI
jgi:hypothetical protein